MTFSLKGGLIPGMKWLPSGPTSICLMSDAGVDTHWIILLEGPVGVSEKEIALSEKHFNTCPTTKQVSRFSLTLSISQAPLNSPGGVV